MKPNTYTKAQVTPGSLWSWRNETQIFILVIEVIDENMYFGIYNYGNKLTMSHLPISMLCGPTTAWKRIG